MDRTAAPIERIVICCLCRRRVYRQRNGEWYHLRNGSTACRPGDGNRERRATPLEIEVAAR
jgi:hypothetical protein